MVSTEYGWKGLAQVVFFLLLIVSFITGMAASIGEEQGKKIFELEDKLQQMEANKNIFKARYLRLAGLLRRVNDFLAMKPNIELMAEIKEVLNYKV